MAQLEPLLAAQLEHWRAEGKCIVFTNGVFDILHFGHVKQLESARSFGDILIVGLNSDASVRLLEKGPGRPINPELARREVLLALSCVDAVALFDEPTPLALLELVRPQVLVKGADYAAGQVVGRELVESYGGRIELVPLVPGYSTTEIIRRIRELA